VSPYDYELERPDRLGGGERATGAHPVIVFLHGAGERGGVRADQVRKHGPWKGRPFNARVAGRLGPYFVIAPHLPGGRWEPQRVLDTLCSAFGELKKGHGDQVVDVARVSITGISLGGRGALEVAERGFPDPRKGDCDTSAPHCLAFRAAAIVCPMEGSAAGLRADTPYQFFQRDHDWNAPTRDTYGNLQKSPAAFHRYQGCNHNCWTATYANAALYDWFEQLTPQDWGPACDASMCVDRASEVVEVRDSKSGKRPFGASFCPVHAAQAPQWRKYAEYISRVP